MRPYFVLSATALVVIFTLLYFFFYIPIAKAPRAVPTLAGISVLPTVRVAPGAGAVEFQPPPKPPRSGGLGGGASTESSATSADSIHTTSPKTKSAAKPKTLGTTLPTTKQALPAASNTQPTATFSTLARGAKNLRGALVNILCTASPQGKIRSISGSGVIISPKGVILTNAHIGQYFLLSNYPTPGGVRCVIRTGSPATAAYHASLLFISPAWIYANPKVLTEAAPTGTGKYDIALLAITKSTTNTSPPTSFPFVPLATRAPTIGEPVVIGSYAAQFLSTSEIQSSLYPTIAYSAVKNIYTLTSTSSDEVDVASFGGTAAAQEGSSGGGVLSSGGELVSTITTSTIKGATGDRTLYAITAPYIRREYAAETSQTLAALLKESTSTARESFAPEIAKLTTFLTQTLVAHQN